MKKLEHPVNILMRPILIMLERRMNEILLIAYKEGLKDGKKEKP